MNYLEDVTERNKLMLNYIVAKYLYYVMKLSDNLNKEQLKKLMFGLKKWLTQGNLLAVWKKRLVVVIVQQLENMLNIKLVNNKITSNLGLFVCYTIKIKWRLIK